jgi:radical SAM family uncharacterized protein
MEKHMSEPLWPRIEPLLALVEKPSRYINHEWNAGSFQTSASYHAIYLYPDTYEIGQSNQAIAILYQASNQIDDVSAERAFLPWIDMITQMREHGIPLFGMESQLPLADCDLLGITLPHELAFSNVLEALDLAGIPQQAADRGDDMPLVLGGGPCVFNPEPFAFIFDAILIGEGEEAIVEIIELHKALKAQGLSRRQVLEQLAGVPGVYVPLLQDPARDRFLVEKRLLQDFDAYPPVVEQVVPYVECAHDRLTIEILRGCTRGCRFCQAGMIYRPVRERSADTIVDSVMRGLACTGFDEVSLTSLSTTDHSQIAQVLRRLNQALADTGIGVSIPSQRMDAFGVEMAYLVAGSKKAGLTFAPEAATQRLRDVINKNVSEDDIITAVEQAFTAGWRRCKLYFMIGLPGETDEDVAAIAHLANRVYAAAKDAVPDNQRGNVRLNISVALFVPKAGTPFQWCGQISREEAARRIQVIREAGLHKGVDMSWHDPVSSMLEAVISRGGRDLGALLQAAWRHGARFDAWSEQFNFAAWQDAANECGIDLQAYASRDFDTQDTLPWDHISSGVDKGYLELEYQRSLAGDTTVDCSFDSCTSCGACDNLGAQVRLGGGQRG